MALGSLVNIGFLGWTGIEGANQGKKDAKAEIQNANPYDVKLGNIKSGKAVDHLRYANNRTIGSAPLVKSAAIEYVDNGDVKHHNKMLYIAPAALLTAAVLRGRTTGNALQLADDVVNAVKKVKPAKVGLAGMRSSGNVMMRDVANNAANNAANAAKDRTFVNSLKGGMGFAGGAAAIDIGVNKATSNQNKEAQLHSLFEKTAKEVPGAKGYIEKLVTEGVLQPSISAMPIYLAPLGVSLALNKDIKGSFGPVRDSEKNIVKKKKDISDADPRSRNNYVTNAAIMGVASDDMNMFMEKVAAAKPYRIKDWSEFGKELPVQGLRSVSMAVPMSLIAVYADPAAKFKARRAAEEKEQYEKELVNEAAKISKRRVMNAIK